MSTISTDLYDLFPKVAGAYLVGGAVRDLLLDRTPADYDIAVQDNPEVYAETLARQTGGHVIPIGKPGWTIFRVAMPGMLVDVSAVAGSGIEPDLRRRDFTMNALALELTTGQIIDCTGGLRDIQERRVRMVSEAAFVRDPVRLLRAYRMGAVFGFRIDPETGTAVTKHAWRIHRTAGERIRTELFKLFRSSVSHRYVTAMADSGLLFAVFPEMNPMKGCAQNRFHALDVWAHTGSAFACLETLLDRHPPEIAGLGEHLGPYLDPERTGWLKAAILLHDIGKPATRSVDRAGEAHFYGHEQKSAEMVASIAERLRFSTRQTRFILFVIAHHLRPLHLFNAHRRGELSRRAITRFFMKAGEHIPFLILHALADSRGKEAGKPEDQEQFTAFGADLLRQFFLDFQARQVKEPLITGRDLIRRFHLSPSPQFKTILNRIEEERLSGLIRNREEAIRRVAVMLEGK